MTADEALVLLVDDHPLFSGGFGHMVAARRPGWTLRTAATGAEALAALRAVSPDLVIIDVMLPDGDGFGLAAKIGEAWPELTVALVSGRDDAGMRVRARASGAAGFIPKTEAPDAIIAMVERMLSGGTAFPVEAEAGGLPVLTPRQADILALLAEGHANKEIRYRLGIAERTVRAHLTELFQILGANSRMQAVIRARELGLIS